MLFDGRPAQIEAIREIADNINDPVFLIDQAFNVWYHNRAFALAVGVRMNAARFRSLPCHQLLGLSICAESCAMRRAIAEQQTVRLAEISGRAISGNDKQFYVNAIPLQNANGNYFGALIILRDVTDEANIQNKYRSLLSRNRNVALSGAIDGGNLPDIIQLVAFLQKSGYLNIERGSDHAVLAFENGQMVSCELPPVHGEKAFGRLLEWDTGSFHFKPAAEVSVSQRMTKSADFVVMDAVREKDELTSQEAKLPRSDSVLSVPTPPASDAELSDADREILALAQHNPSLADLLDHATATDAACRLTLVRLRDRGYVTWAP